MAATGPVDGVGLMDRLRPAEAASVPLPFDIEAARAGDVGGLDALVTVVSI